MTEREKHTIFEYAGIIIKKIGLIVKKYPKQVVVLVVFALGFIAGKLL